MTTRQAIQIHFVMLEDTPKVMRRLAEVGITTREACGHTVRNITADPLTGIAEDCVFDVTPYAEAAMRYFLRNTVNQKLPRKFKITYSASEEDRGLIPIHDIGLMAVEQGGQQGFRVSVGGGLGAAPRVADVLVDFIPVHEQLRTIEATIRVWDRLGERRNKNKARIKFLVAKLGIDEFRRLYEAGAGDAAAGERRAVPRAGLHAARRGAGGRIVRVAQRRPGEAARGLRGVAAHERAAADAGGLTTRRTCCCRSAT